MFLSFQGPPPWLSVGAKVDVLAPVDGIWYIGTVSSLGTKDDGSVFFVVKFPHHEEEIYKWKES